MAPPPVAQTAVTLGPEAIEDISRTLDALLPWLIASEYRVKPDGNLEFTHAEPAEAIRMLRGHTEEVIDDEVRALVGTRSGLGWNVFFGHVVTWWLPQRQRLGFLRALVDRFALHRVDLRLHWNEGRTLTPTRQKPTDQVLWWGGGAGLLAGIGATRLWPNDPVLALLIAGGAVVIARIYQRIGVWRSCGDPLCRAPLSGRRVCRSCGARAQ